MDNRTLHSIAATDTRDLVRYISTRGQAPELGFEDVLLAGLARDGGLYLPAEWPRISEDTMRSFRNKPFAEVACEIILPFVAPTIDRAALSKMTSEAYAGFGDDQVTPVVDLDDNLSILELFHGPTLAFKDIAMQMLARMMDHVLAKRNARATIVGATSGDTGGAAIEAFRASQRSDIFILFPDGRVSDVQRRMMTTPKEKNVHATAIAGTFDDCQALVKSMFNDHEFRDQVELSGVNSINWARIVAQVTYYFVAAVRLGAPEKNVSFAVPTGNFGDIFAGFAAKQMGLPIDRLIIASNENDILPRTVATGVYEMRGVVPTSSPSMDIQISSNFERYLFEASGRNGERVRALMKELAEQGRFDLGALWSNLKEDFSAYSASEEDVANAIRHASEQYNYLFDPHTACAYVAVRRQAGDDRIVILSTAHPAKFPDAMEKITGSRPPLPDRLSDLMTDPENYETLANDLDVVKKFVNDRLNSSQKASV